MSALLRVTRWLTARWRQSLVLSITLLAIAGVAVFAFVLARVVGHQMQSDALAHAKATAELVARSSFAPRLPAAGQRLPRAAVRVLDKQVAAARASDPGTSVVLLDPRGRVMYANGTTVARRAISLPVAVGTRVVGSGGGRRVRSVLPVRTSPGRPTAAYLQLEVPYAPIAQGIRSRTRRLDLVLALTALGVYLLVLPVILRTRRTLRVQYDPRRVQLAHDVKRAVKRGELSLAFQPIVSSRPGHVLRSFEVLVRWTDPRRGVIAPASFIPALETTDAIWDLSSCVFELACAQQAEWRARRIEVPLALNLSGAVLLDDRLVPTLRGLVERWDLSPDAIELEITEGALVQDAERASGVIRQIAAIGLRVIAIDDFGTGYSSLSRLHELPLDTLKVDQSFVKRMATEGDATIVRSVIDLAHALNLDVIAEGVEDEATAVRLGELGAECIQGYYISRPLPAEGVVEWLEAQRAIPFMRAAQAPVGV